MQPSLRSRWLPCLLLASALVLSACQRSAPASPTPSPTPDPAQHSPANRAPERPTEGGLTEEQVARFNQIIDEATLVYDLGGFDEGMAMLQTIIDEAPQTEDALRDLLDMMEAGHPKNLDVYPHLPEGAVMHDRRLIDLYDHMPPLLLALFEVPVSESYNAAIFSLDTEYWVWDLETIVFPDGCWYVSGLETELRGVGKELVLYALCNDEAPVTELLIVWEDLGTWMGTWNTVSGEATVAETLDLLEGTQMLTIESGTETLTMWWDGEDFAEQVN